VVRNISVCSGLK